MRRRKTTKKRMRTVSQVKTSKVKMSKAKMSKVKKNKAKTIKARMRSKRRRRAYESVASNERIDEGEDTKEELSQFRY